MWRVQGRKIRISSGLVQPPMRLLPLQHPRLLSHLQMLTEGQPQQRQQMRHQRQRWQAALQVQARAQLVSRHRLLHPEPLMLLHQAAARAARVASPAAASSNCSQHLEQCTQFLPRLRALQRSCWPFSMAVGLRKARVDWPEHPGPRPLPACQSLTSRFTPATAYPPPLNKQPLTLCKRLSMATALLVCMQQPAAQLPTAPLPAAKPVRPQGQESQAWLVAKRVVALRQPLCWIAIAPFSHLLLVHPSLNTWLRQHMLLKQPRRQQQCLLHLQVGCSPQQPAARFTSRRRR